MHVANNLGLSGYVDPRDFKCTAALNVYRCAANNAGSLTTYKKLQTQVRSISQQMAMAGVLQVPADLVTVSSDGRIGPTTALGVQFIAAAFASVVPPPGVVGQLLDNSLPAASVIRTIAENAEEIVAYFELASKDPEAFRAKPIIEIREPPHKRITPAGAVAIGAGVLAVLGLFAAGVYWQTGSEGSLYGLSPSDYLKAAKDNEKTARNIRRSGGDRRRARYYDDIARHYRTRAREA